jgi:nicotinate-nucleotide pyrophosphorylase (carboxylating)
MLSQDLGRGGSEAKALVAQRARGENGRMHVDRHALEDMVARWLAEDLGRGDVTTAAVIAPDRAGIALIEARQPAVLAGIEAAHACFELASFRSVDWHAFVSDGTEFGAGDALARIEGPLGAILAAERTALNLLGHLSGIATLTRRFSKEVEGTAAKIVDTRKTTPGMRLLEKAAVRAGGGSNHRFGLDDGVLIKDNHVAAVGSVEEAVRLARSSVPHGLRIEVEVTTLEQLDEAIASGADAILLDNMEPATVAAAVERAGGKAILEASGGITLDNVRRYAETGVDLISIGALTHSAPNVDVALEVQA